MNQLGNDSDNHYCVPAALSILTGLPVDNCVTKIREHLGDQTISGVLIPVAIQVLESLGYSINRAEFTEGSTVLTASLGLLSTYLVSTGGHALVIKDGMIFDNSYPNGVSPKDYPGKKTRIKQAYRITK